MTWHLPLLRPVVALLLVLAYCSTGHSQDEPKTSEPLAEIPFQVIGSHILVQLQVNDAEESSSFVFDSGASATVIDKAFAKKLELEPDMAQPATGAGGSEVYEICLKQKLRFRNLEINPVIFVLTDLSSLANQMDHPIQGITGSDFFKRYLVELNHTDQVIRLFSKDKKLDTEGYEAVKFKNFGPSSIPVVDVAFELENGDSYNGKFVLDTGAGLTLLLNTPFNEENNIKEKSGKSITREAGGLTKRSLYDTVKIKSAKFAGVDFGEMEIQLSNAEEGVTSQSDVTGLIGNDILRRFDILTDYPNKTLYFRPNKTIGDEFEFNVSGLQLEKIDGKVVIQRIAKGSLAEQAGLKLGDNIVSIDGKVSNKLHDLDDLLSEEDKRVSVVVSRDGKELTFSFALKRLL